MAAPPIKLPFEPRTATALERILISVAAIFILPGSIYFIHASVARTLEYWAERNFARVGLTLGLGVPLSLFCFGMFLLLLDLLLKRVRMTDSGVSIRGLYRRGFSWADVTSAEIEIGKHTVSLVVKTKGQKFEIGIGDEPTYNAACLIVEHYAATPGAPINQSVSEHRHRPGLETIAGMSILALFALFGVAGCIGASYSAVSGSAPLWGALGMLPLAALIAAGCGYALWVGITRMFCIRRIRLLDASAFEILTWRGAVYRARLPEDVEMHMVKGDLTLHVKVGTRRLIISVDDFTESHTIKAWLQNATRTCQNDLPLRNTG